MISTIGSLVQVTQQRFRWALAAVLFASSTAASAILFGAILGTLGALLRRPVTYLLGPVGVPHLGLFAVGTVAVAYACSDLGMVRLPRPHFMAAVPVTWWRRWQPYGASAAYGAALGLGLTTRIAFGAFYAVCAACVVSASPGYGAALMGTYGVVRGASIFPSSAALLRVRTCEALFSGRAFQESRLRYLLALLTVSAGAALISASVGNGW